MLYRNDPNHLAFFLRGDKENANRSVGAHEDFSARLFDRVFICLNPPEENSRVDVYKNELCYVLIPAQTTHKQEYIGRINKFFCVLLENSRVKKTCTDRTVTNSENIEIHRTFLEANAQYCSILFEDQDLDYHIAKKLGEQDPDAGVILLSKGVILGCHEGFSQLFNITDMNLEDVLLKKAGEEHPA